ncbi:hypothetical protein Patl1_21611 [Pistacia atlantica]|uniref:Uncharacterized protein n=1 Tax=Pistacia atlantica TaxID=434234 RepID=A0ACC1BIQ6_9ROSI|nr:hypothetical protein Patl1_21611 [Pistacia atlantica]
MLAKLDHLKNLTLAGGGIFHGQGQTTWPQNDCNKNLKCKLPVIKSIKISTPGDSPNTGGIQISTPGDSPNTGGIHIGSSKGIKIYDSAISTGDACVSVSPGSENILVSDVFCGLGHGISAQVMV